MLEKRKILAVAELAAAEITEAALETEGTVAEDADAEVYGEDGLKARWLPAMLNMNDRDGLGDKNYAFVLSFSLLLRLHKRALPMATWSKSDWHIGFLNL
jgi:hypothetical protein